MLPMVGAVAQFRFQRFEPGKARPAQPFFVFPKVAAYRSLKVLMLHAALQDD